MSSFEHEEMMMIAKSKIQYHLGMDDGAGPRIRDCNDDAIAMHASQRLPTRRVLRESLSRVSTCEQSDTCSPGGPRASYRRVGMAVPVRSVARSMHDVLAFWLPTSEVAGAEKAPGSYRFCSCRGCCIYRPRGLRANFFWFVFQGRGFNCTIV